MPARDSYQEAVRDTLLRYAALRPSHGDIRLDPVFDELRGRYVLMQVGWDRGRRVKGVLLYVRVEDGRVFIEYDGLEQSITEELIRRGIPDDDIVLAYMSAATV